MSQQPRYKKLTFAGNVKEAAAKMLTAFSEHVERPSRVITVADIEQRKAEPEVRKFLQMVGTEIGRKFFGDPDLWLYNVQTGVDFYNLKGYPVVIDDCRFENEEACLRDLGFLFVRVVRDNYEQELVKSVREKNPDLPQNAIDEIVTNMILHPSETYIDSIEADIVIHATDLTQLHRELERTLGGYIASKNN